MLPVLGSVVAAWVFDVGGLADRRGCRACLGVGVWRLVAFPGITRLAQRSGHPHEPLASRPSDRRGHPVGLVRRRAHHDQSGLARLGPAARLTVAVRLSGWQPEFEVRVLSTLWLKGAECRVDASACLRRGLRDVRH